MRMKTGVCFDDVLLVPQYSPIRSRRDIDLLTEVKNVRHKFTLPVISSPMDTVTETKMVVAMAKAGGLGIIHRYNTIEEQVKIASEAYELLYEEDNNARHGMAAAIGVTEGYIDRATALYDTNVRIFCLDVAHGHHIIMKQALHRLRDIFGNTVHIMAGNVATLEGFNDLADWGADSIRVGIGGGSICSTRLQTGHGMPTLQSVLECAQSDRDVMLIADGGIRTSGDIVKAYAAGADFIMIGSLLAGTDETPGDVEYADNGYEYCVTSTAAAAVCAPAGVSYTYDSEPKGVKKYRGMASKEAQVDWRGYPSSIEGVSTTVPLKGPVGAILHELEVGIRSGLSYSGAKTIRELQAKAQFMKQSYSGTSEGSTHILNGD